MSDALIVERRGQVHEITINRPEQRNALNEEVRNGLFDAFRAAQEDPTCRVVIVTGAGDRAFSAGADLKELAELGITDPGPDFTPRLGRNVQLDKPVIAAVNGAAYAGGFLLAQMADLCVASTNASFCIAEARVGRGAPWSTKLAGLLPRRVYVELLVLADPISAQRAYELGFVNRLVEPDALMGAARELATRICANAPLTVAGHLQVVDLAYRMDEHAAEDAANEVFAPIYHSEDAQEGPRAFRERRAPVWKGR
ncbi:enoyl-CoA hydratase/isomerase family protein [Nocardioides hwasunensis]|uniref:Enoyl-CoA hydratase/isomerase family protein n=1 Tax=Nocardioides hwasunensis TaxID=397258 RepID=A0ABR8MHN1_9ACTN|nr:enoyl-CoA hydratase-related protein [Nocardioides hwasunensis]MBD3915070.1 enoyl-CoA hydratase/isomerase family protein [Nocardioides hwasunensis]